MALLQISEPGQSPDPHQRRVAIGIDLGTTHSLVASVRHGVAECLADAQGRVILPSAVRYLPGGRRQIGHDARDAQADDADKAAVKNMSTKEAKKAAELAPYVEAALRRKQWLAPLAEGEIPSVKAYGRPDAQAALSAATR